VYVKSSPEPAVELDPPDVVTCTFAAPGVTVAGVTIVNDVGVTDVTESAGTAVPPTVTDTPVTNPVPDTVTDVPPVTGPVAGDRPVTVGTGAVYAKLSVVPDVELDPPEVVTCTSTVLTVTVAGDTTVIDVADTTVTLVPASAPNATDAPVRKPVPVIVTVVPPDVGPVAGEIDVTVGTGAVYAKSSPVPDVDELPPDVVTCTSTVATDVLAGDTTVIDVGDTTVTLVPASAPKATVAPVMNPVPVIVTVVLPEVGPVAGEIDVTDGTAAVYEKLLLVCDAADELVADTTAVPVAMTAGVTSVADVDDVTFTDVAA
jgi:hypothetical protein